MPSNAIAAVQNAGTATLTFSTMKFELVWDANCAVGESCVFDAARGLLWFCDCWAGRVFAWSVRDGSRRRYTIADYVGSIALCRTGHLLVALRQSLILFDPDDLSVRPFTELSGEPSSNRLNDGKVGPDGCFWVGTMDWSVDKAAVGSLFRIRPDGRVERKVAGGIKVSNGLAWAPDGTTMFHSDSRGPWIDGWDFDVREGSLGRRRRIATLSESEGRPDGAAFDLDGVYWSAGVSAGRLNRFSSDGTHLGFVTTPAACPTMPCFADGFIYVTSLWGGQSSERLAGDPAPGGLFRAPVGVGGVPVGMFDLAD